jgi:hypothetical protein
MEATFSYDDGAFIAEHAGGSIYISADFVMPNIMDINDGGNYYARENLGNVITSVKIRDGIFTISFTTCINGEENDISFKILFNESAKQSLIDAINSKWGAWKKKYCRDEEEDSYDI